MNARSEDFLLCEIHSGTLNFIWHLDQLCVSVCDCTVHYLPRETLNKTVLTLSHTLHTHWQ